MSGRLPALCLLLLLLLAACNQAAPPATVAPPEAAAPQLEPAVPQLEAQATTSRMFSSTGAEQTFVVPAGITSVTVVARGAPGGTSGVAGAGGRGAVVTAELTVTPGQTLYLNVGGAPTLNSGCYPNATCIGGFNGGGSNSLYGGGGGGASDVRTVSRTETGSLESRLLVAAGGGGGGFSDVCNSRRQQGGAGGDAGSAGGTGDACNTTPGGTGGAAGTQSAGGTGGNPEGASGSLGQGGNGGDRYGGGGGGGFHGGGGGGKYVASPDYSTYSSAGGGGGGSSLDPDGGSITLDDSRKPQITISYTKQDQTISFTSTAPTDATVGGSYTPTATATSGLSVTFGTSTPSTCTFSDDTVSFIATGECIVTADQAGDESYAAAPQTTQSFTIKQDQTVSFTSTAPTDAIVGGSYTPTATATSGLTVTFGTSTPEVCTFSSGTVSFVAAGECTVTADQAGDTTYNAAAQVTQTFTIAAKQDQTVSFTSQAPTGATVGGSYTPSAAATSGLSVTLGTSTPTTCTISNGSVSFIAAGTCTVTADQAGDATYNPAAQATQSFTISLPPTTQDPYTIDFESAPANRLTYSVKVGQGVVYNGQGVASSASVPVVGKRANNGKILEAQVARVVSLYGSKRLIIGSSASSNTPAPTGGRIKLTFTNYDPAGAKLTSMTLSNLTKRGAYLTFYYANGSSSRQNLGTTSAGGSLIVPLAVENLRAVDVYAPNAYAVDDVKFEVAPKR